MTNAGGQDAPVLPAYRGGSIADIVPALLGSGDPRDRLPCLPDGISEARSVVLLVLDGLGWEQLSEHAACAPTLTAMSGARLTSVAPTTTAAALTSITTGLTPAEHGIIGYRMHMGGNVMNVLRWGDNNGDLRSTYPPRTVQPCPPFLGQSVPVLSKAELEGSGFTMAHLDGVRHHGWRMASSLPVAISQLVAAGEKFVYAYYDGIDKIAHERGFGPFYDAELESADRLVSRILDRLPSTSYLLVTSDHGQVHIGDSVRRLDPTVAALSHAISGEGRFRWLHAKRGKESELLAATESGHGHEAWVVERSRVLDEGWFGPVASTDTVRRMGDVALVAREAVSFADPAEGADIDLVCRHGSLTGAEMFVPLLFGQGRL